MQTSQIKKPLVLVPLVMIAAIALVAVLAWTAMKPINQKNGFDRKVIDVQLSIYSSMKNEGIIELSGATDHHVYFQSKDPSQLIVTDYSLKDRKDLRLRIPDNKKMLTSNIYVDSPHISIMAGRIPLTIEGEINGINSAAYKFPGSLFTRSVRISEDSYIYRGFDTTLKTVDQIFLKGHPSRGTTVRERNISEQNNDAGISTDGILCYDQQSGLLIYTMHYRNQFLCLDTNLNLIYKGQTIDTFSNAAINSELDAKQKLITALSPKRLINAACVATNNYLYNNSALRGDNEDVESFKKGSAIDIYHLKTGQYRGSFYIPAYKDEKVKKFNIVGNKLIALYKSNIVIYNFKDPGSV